MNTHTSNIRILMVGGGTGGHFYPLMSVAEALRGIPSVPELYYAGPDPYDAPLLAQNGLIFTRIAAGKRRRYSSVQNFFDIFKTVFGTIVAVVKLYIVYPDVVMSKGGYTSVPVVLAAAFLRIPIVVHESDAVMGAANKLATRYARDVITAYDETYATFTHSRVHKLGIPVRTALLAPPSPNAIATLGIDPNRPVILILGGSQGAERVNSLILDSLDELLPTFSIIHQTGKQNYENCTHSADALIPDTELRKHYHPLPFLDGVLLNDAYHVAHIVISRAGSTSLYEIALHGKPSVIIPIPEEISHDQRKNAYAYARFGGAIVIEEQNLSDSLLCTEIDRIMQNDELYAGMVKGAESFARRDTAGQIASLLVEIAETHQS
jgi:UDP-N-acetylglucosamine--N-acetylmuramyl-(pentapeptide) pyrophosphoryl-undecaprenol N-acetylglucosamine transferase